ncbi:hypothetical protein B0H14DRAFT_3534427 [Mycena olivaceomarginata]|nr:hypothetical protein B0H14DRAFT_3534427 [Mycena olivaceomarginata]
MPDAARKPCPPRKLHSLHALLVASVGASASPPSRGSKNPLKYCKYGTAISAFPDMPDAARKPYPPRKLHSLHALLVASVGARASPPSRGSPHTIPRSPLRTRLDASKKKAGRDKWHSRPARDHPPRCRHLPTLPRDRLVQAEQTARPCPALPPLPLFNGASAAPPALLVTI